ncbi:MAG: tetratricopeptide repeat protein [Chitinophagales bacterium]|nr:tetratricopeptide repeat protein [Chitinophagales bacterium]
MSIRLSLTCIAILLNISVFANGNYEDWWQKGNNYYTQKNYDSAAYCYNQLAQLQPGNAEVYYNLGNTYYRLNLISKAILNYERALKAEPGHKQAADNLYLTQSRIKNRIQALPEIFFIRWWKSMTGNNLANIYAGIAAFLFLLLIGYQIAKKLGYLTLDVPVQATWAAVSLSVLFIILSIVSAQGSISATQAIVMQEEAQMMREPKYAQPLSLIPEGTKVDISKEEAGWYEVRLPDGRTGWLATATVEKI